MHLLIRDPTAPSCLNTLSNPPDSWAALSNTDKDVIWQKLELMQGSCCAYCENIFSGRQRHIEHFKTRSRFRGDTFNWSNLFGSCNSRNSCGHYKDNAQNPNINYNPDDLIKPDIDDPAHYLMFSSDGSVVPKAGLLTFQAQKAQLTIDVFCLNGSLRQERQSALKDYEEDVRYFFVELPNLVTTDEWQSMYHAKLSKIEGQAFSSAIKQLFKG